MPNGELAYATFWGALVNLDTPVLYIISIFGQQTAWGALLRSKNILDEGNFAPDSRCLISQNKVTLVYGVFVV